MSWTSIPTHVTGDVLPAADWNAVGADLAFVHDQGADLASAATITPTVGFHRITGTTTITAITAPSGTGQGGNRLLLKFQSAGCAITPGAALVLNGGPFNSIAGGTIEFLWDATAALWLEIDRANGDVIAYAESTTASTTVSAITAATAQTIVTAPAFVADGSTSVAVEIFVPTIRNNADPTHIINIVLYEGSSQVATLYQGLHGAGISLKSPKQTPAAGSRTYSARVYFAAVSGGAADNWQAGSGGAGTLGAAYIRVVRLP